VSRKKKLMKTMTKTTIIRPVYLRMFSIMQVEGWCRMAGG
jgi:hypothetical protein